MRSTGSRAGSPTPFPKNSSGDSAPMPATARATATSAPSSPRTCSSNRCCTATLPSPTCAVSAAWTSPTPPTARPAPVCPWNCSTASSRPSPTACVKTATTGPRPLAWPSRLPAGRLQFLHARHPGVAAHFGQPSGQAEGCGFPVAHLMALFDARRGYLLRAMAQPLYTRDMSQAAAVHAELPRATCWWATGRSALTPTWRCARSGAFTACSAPHQRQIVSFRPGRRHGAKGRPTSRWLRRLGSRDQRVEYFKPKGRPEWMTAQQYAALAASIVVRELRYEVGRPGCRTRVVQNDQPSGRMPPRIQQRGQQPMLPARPRSARIVPRVLDDPHHHAAFIPLAVLGRRVQPGQVRAVPQPLPWPKHQVVLDGASSWARRRRT